MKTYLADVIPKIQRFSQKLDNLALLTNQHWVVLDELKSSKNIYIFRSNNELIISQNGKVQKGKWEYLGNNSILIDQKDESYLFKHGFFDANILALKVDNKSEYALLVNENKYGSELNSVEGVLDFLSSKYLVPNIRKQIDQKIMEEGFAEVISSTGIEKIEASINEDGNTVKNPWWEENGGYVLIFFWLIMILISVIVVITTYK